MTCGQQHKIITETTPGGRKKTLNSHKSKALSQGRKVVEFSRAETKKESPRWAGSTPVNENEESAEVSGMINIVNNNPAKHE